MKFAFNNKAFKFASDNSNECNQDVAFIQTFQNTKYLPHALQKGAHSVVNIKDLAEDFGLDKIKIIAVTGTNGKTTTASAIYSILLDLGFKTALQGTRGLFINDETVEAKTLTTPSVVDTYRHIYQAVNMGCKYFVMEVSSHAIAQQRIEGINFELKILTNITQDHLDFHKTIEEYISVKNSFFQDTGKKLINKDEPKASFNPKNCYTYGIENPATYKLLAYSLNNGLSGIIGHFDQTASFASLLEGLFNLYNILAAVSAVDLVTKNTLQEICDKVDNFAGVGGRMEVVWNEPKVIVDFAHTPDGMAQVLNALKEKELIVVFGAGGDRDKLKRPIMGKIASSLSKKVFLTSDNPRFEDPKDIINDILEGVAHKENITVNLNRKEAIYQALDAREGDEIVVILGKGDEEYQIIYDKKIPLNDKDIVLSYFNEITHYNEQSPL